MNHMMSDEELDALFSEHEQSHQQPQQQPQPARVAEEHPHPQMPQIPIYPLSLAGQQQQNPNGQNEPLLKRRFGGVPVWAWGIIAAGVGGTGYLFYQNRKQAKQTSEQSSSTSSEPVEANPAPQLPESTSSGGWSPSRSKVADQLNRYFQRKGAADKVVVWHDADEAKERGKLKHVSPLVNIQVKGDFKVDKDFERFCRREGLNPVQHQDKSIGLYPTESKRGKEWERYIDALRDDGQKV